VLHGDQSVTCLFGQLKHTFRFNPRTMLDANTTYLVAIKFYPSWLANVNSSRDKILCQTLNFCGLTIRLN
jgi:hypothetical protein